MLYASGVQPEALSSGFNILDLALEINEPTVFLTGRLREFPRFLQVVRDLVDSCQSMPVAG
jgi:hypothetical protein